MEQIKHTHVQVRGLRLHVAEIGTGTKVVLFLHGFPEIWYTWRHQMVAVAEAGYRAIAIDFRGYGLSDQPPEPEKGTLMDLVDDVVALLDTLGISKVFLVGKDFGALPISLLAALHPDRVSAFVTLGVPFMLPGANAVQNHLMPKVAGDDQEIMDLVDPSTPLPPWFSEEDLAVYASLYEKSGFRYPLQVPYRSLVIDSGITCPKVKCPALFIMGEKDYVLKFVGMEDYIRSGQVKNFVPELSILFLEEGSHFVHEQLPEQVNAILIDFLNKHSN
ncbi:hypothetical protein GH714_043556 [Hevea brasiliensis]|uniref:AB hydrolase-1 domain-containing protein n=1 Tax=Hevea brasiliensis TaxID=3981 RepID=A0A6A6K4V9_HEVBR|nr:hypothetical protein GH714_043556 [Hevea brasiliensis]